MVNSMEEDLKTMNIALVAPVPPPYGGIANWTRLLLENTPREKIDYHVINIAPKKRAMDGRTIFDRIVVSGIDSFRIYKELKEIVKQHNINTIHMTTSGQLAIFRDYLLFQWVKRKGKKGIYHIRFGRVPEIVEKNTFEWRAMKKVIDKATYVIAIDKKTYDCLYFKFGEKIKYIPNPIDIDKIQMNSVETQKELTFLGWCIKTKGIEELLEAWGNIEHREWKLNIVGPYAEEYLEELKKRFKCTNVVFWGEMEHTEAMNIVHSSEIFVLPSYSEGFPNVILEAMTLKKAIIATNVGAIPEMLDGGCGEVIEKKNVEQLQGAITKLINDSQLRQTYGAKAYEKVSKEYSFGKILEQYIKLW